MQQPKSQPKPAAQVAAQVFFYLTLPLTYLSQRQNYWTPVDSHVLLGAASTAFVPHVDAPVACGVGAVVNRCDEYACPTNQYKRHHIQQLQLPTVDHLYPSLEALTAAVAFIQMQKQRESGRVSEWENATCAKLLYLHPDVRAFYHKVWSLNEGDKQDEDGVLPRRKKKDPDAVNQKPRVENVNALLDIHMDRTSNGT
uniref:Uncharacterized protein n=1 Tax=Peronospora matthiolae TaxID=2874970 RepID=A0AAV1UIM6_9STRA